MSWIESQEIYNRIDRFQNYLKDLELSGALILQNVDRFYFSGTLQNSTLFIPAEGEAILIVHKAFSRATQESPLKNIVSEKPSNIKKVLQDYGIKTDRIGMELDVLPVNIYLKYKRILEPSEITDISHIIRKTRMIKSEYEIAQIKKAAQILDENLYEVQKILKPGITELEVDAYLGYLIRKKGHIGMMRMRGWNQEMMYVHVLSGKGGAIASFLNSPQGGTGISPAIAQGASYKKIERNEPIQIDHGICINGYIGDQTRTFVIGELADILKKAHDCSYEIHHFFAENAKIGTTCDSLYHGAVKIAKDWRLDDYFMGFGDGKVRFIGHGIGLEIDEYPIISPHFKEPLQEGMVLSLEPKFVFPDLGVVGMEDIYLIGEHTQRITNIEQKVFEIKA